MSDEPAIAIGPHRSVPEWIGKTPDSVPPKAVRLRVFARHEGRCHISGVKILTGDAWDLEHIKPLAMARPGEILNRESNLAPALKQPHREKTARENSDRAKADRTRLKHIGAWPKSKNPIKGRGFSPGRNRQFEGETDQ